MKKLSLITLWLALCCGLLPETERAQASIAGHWEGAVTREGKQWRVWIDIFPKGESFKGTIDIPDDGLYSLPLSVKLDGTKLQISHAYPESSLSFNGELSGDEIAGEWKGLQVTASFKLRRTQTEPAAFIEEEVRCQSGEALLAGTLVKPQRAGRHPLIIFVHGSGNQTRGRSRYRSQAYLFARHGIAALVYDRRGQGASTGDSRRNLDIPILADDVVALARCLKSREDINPRQIAVSGLSQGGWVTPLAASLSKDIAFVQVISAAGLTVAEQDDFVVENLIRQQKKIPEDKLAGVIDLIRRVRNFSIAGKGDAARMESEIARLRSEPWFKHAQLPEGKIERWSADIIRFISFDPIPAWEKVSAPVLAIWGAQDALVPAERSRAAIELSLRKAGNKDFTMKVFPKASHQMGVVRNESEAWDWPRLAPGYQEMMVEWLLKRVSVAK